MKSRLKNTLIRIYRLVNIRYLYHKFFGYTLNINGEKISVNISSYSGSYRETLYFQQNESDLMSDIISECDSDTVFLDVGANIGLSSIVIDGIVSEVYSIEPHPVNCSHLLTNTEINNSGINIYQCALSNECGYLKLKGTRGGFSADGSAALVTNDISISHKGDRSQMTAELMIPVETGDNLIDTEINRHPNIIKIDVEGAEKRVIEGLEKTLDDKECEIVYIETHRKGDYDISEITSRLETFGFKIQKNGRGIKAIK